VATIEIEPVKPLIGARVHVDRRDLCDKMVVQRCLEALEDRGVLIFPKIGLTDKEQLAFTDALGTRADFTRTVPGANAADEPGVYKITLDPKINDQPEYVQGTWFWHIDGVTMKMPPPKATLLTARRVAPKGGQTEFSNTYAAYEGLSVEEKQELAGLRIVHSIVSSLRPVIEEPTEEDLKRWSRATVTEHPAVWTHRSGRKSLLIGSHADRVVGMPVPDGRALITRLLQWASHPDFCYRHQWQEGDLVVWDNCGTLHRVIPYDAASGRAMHRTAIQGFEAVQ
jgi:alpha-ketoglutarate-dependent taurine dioxygenase